MADEGRGRGAPGGEGRATGAAERAKAKEERSGSDRFLEEKKRLVERAHGKMTTSMGLLRSSLWSMDTEDPAGPLLVDMAKDAALRLQDAADTLMTLTALEEDDGAPGMCRYGIASLVEECCRPMIPEFEESGVGLDMDDRTGGREFLIDRPGLRLILEALIGHCLDSVERGGRIGVEISLVRDRPGRGELEDERLEVGTVGGRGGDRLRVRIGCGRGGAGRAPALEVCRRLAARQGGELVTGCSVDPGEEFVVFLPAD